MKSLYLLFFGFLFSIIFSPTGANCQKDSKKKRTSEIGLNITNTLAGFFNAGGTNLPTDPFLLSYKKANKSGAIRFGMNFKVTSKKEFLINSGERELKENDFFFRGGYEWRSVIDKRFTFYYGLDAVVEFENEQLNNISFNFDDISSFENVYGFGGGPVLGVLFHLNDRISLSTESSIYGVLLYNESRQEIGNGLPPTENSSTGFRLLPAVPSSLYVIFSF